MIRAGVLTEHDAVELVEGWIVPKIPRNPPHDVAIALAESVLRACLPAGWHIRVQSAITTTDSEPEPDLAIVASSIRDYIAHHPAPDDIALVIEVADSSLQYDRETKSRLYARAGIREFWIINLIDRVVEVFLDPTGPALAPTYRHHEIFTIEQSVALAVAGLPAIRVSIRDLLP